MLCLFCTLLCLHAADCDIFAPATDILSRMAAGVSPIQQQQLGSHPLLLDSPHSDGAHSAAHLTSSDASQATSSPHQQSTNSLLDTVHSQGRRHSFEASSPSGETSQQAEDSGGHPVQASPAGTIRQRAPSRHSEAAPDSATAVGSLLDQETSSHSSALYGPAPDMPMSTCSTSDDMYMPADEHQTSTDLLHVGEPVNQHTALEAEQLSKPHTTGEPSMGQLQPQGSSPRKSAIHKLRSISVKHLFGIKPLTPEGPTAALTRPGPTEGHIAELSTVVIQSSAGPAGSAQQAATTTGLVALPGRDHRTTSPPEGTLAGSNATNAIPLSPRRSISLAKLRTHSLGKQLPVLSNPTQQPQSTPSVSIHAFGTHKPSMALSAALHPRASPEPAPHNSPDALPSSVAGSNQIPGKDTSMYAVTPAPAASVQPMQTLQASASTAVDLADINLVVLHDASSAPAGASAPAAAPAVASGVVGQDLPQDVYVPVLSQAVRVSISADGQRASVTLQVADGAATAEHDTEIFAAADAGVKGLKSPSVMPHCQDTFVPVGEDSRRSDAHAASTTALASSGQPDDSVRADAAQLKKLQKKLAQSISSSAIQSAGEHHMQANQPMQQFVPQQPHAQPLPSPAGDISAVAAAAKECATVTGRLDGDLSQPRPEGASQQPFSCSSSSKKGKSGQGLLGKLEGGLRSLLYKSRSHSIQQTTVRDFPANHMTV